MKKTMALVLMVCVLFITSFSTVNATEGELADTKDDNQYNINGEGTYSTEISFNEYGLMELTIDSEGTLCYSDAISERLETVMYFVTTGTQVRGYGVLITNTINYTVVLEADISNETQAISAEIEIISDECSWFVLYSDKGNGEGEGTISNTETGDNLVTFYTERTDNNGILTIKLLFPNGIPELVNESYEFALELGDGEFSFSGNSYCLPGDVNNNGLIDKLDYVIIKRYCFGTYRLTENELKRADMNGDGCVDKKDYLLCKRKCLG